MRQGLKNADAARGCVPDDDRRGDAANGMANAEKTLLTDIEVKKRQVALLIQLRNLLTDEQMNYLRSIN